MNGPDPRPAVPGWEGRYLVRTQLANENPISRSKARLKPRWRKFDIAALGTILGRLARG